MEVRKRESDRFIVHQRKGSDDEQGSKNLLPEHRTAGVNHGRVNFPFRDGFVIGQSQTYVWCLHALSRFSRIPL